MGNYDGRIRTTWTASEGVDQRIRELSRELYDLCQRQRIPMMLNVITGRGYDPDDERPHTVNSGHTAVTLDPDIVVDRACALFVGIGILLQLQNADAEVQKRVMTDIPVMTAMHAVQSLGELILRHAQHTLDEKKRD